jgi:Cerato-platanin
MKLSLVFTSFAVLLTSVHAQLRVTFDTTYDNANGSMNSVACSNGPNGLLTRGFPTFGSLPNFPFIGGAPAVTFDSPACGSCWNLTYVNPQGNSTSINITAIDAANPNFNIALEAMNVLTDGQASFLGSVPITAVQVASSVCGL